MFLKIRDAWRAIPRWLRILVVITIIAKHGGGGLNKLVMEVNGGRMPVAMQSKDILFVIGPAQLGVEYFLTDLDFMTTPKHQPLTDDTKLRILADRIPIAFSVIPVNGLPYWCYIVFDDMQIPYGEDGIASIGDLFIWLGIPLSFFVSFFLFFHICWRIFLKISGKI